MQIRGWTYPIECLIVLISRIQIFSRLVETLVKRSLMRLDSHIVIVSAIPLN